MRKGLHYLAILLSMTLAACGNHREEKASDTSGAENSLSYARTFQLMHGEGYTRISLPQPWQHATRPATYYLVPKGAPVPEVLAGKPVIRTPLTQVAALSTSYLPMLDMLGVSATVRGFPDTSLIAEPAFRRLAQQGRITDLGNGSQIDRERLLELEPEVVFGFGIGEPAAIDRILQEAGHRMVYNTDFLEEHPLGRAEWIRFFGAFYDKQDLADSLFAAIRLRYDSLKVVAASYSEQPAVMASNLYGDVWYMPGGDSWVATFIEDAGGRYLWADTEGTGSLNLAYEPVLARAQAADIWLNASNYGSLTEMAGADGRYTHFKPWKEGRVYNPLQKGESENGNRYYELGYARPDLVLEDLIRILHAPDTTGSTYHFYRKLD